MYVDGLSTATTVDALSGRGVGMCAVRNDLARVGYEIDVASEPGAGTRFTLRPRAQLAQGQIGEPDNDVAPQTLVSPFFRR